MKRWSSPEELIPALRDGAVVVVPTDTVMGLVGRPLPDTVRRIYEIKRRDPSKPLILFLHRSRVKERPDVPECALRLAEVFWPGPLTLVVPATPQDPPLLQHRGTIGIRHPAPPFPSRLLEAFPKGLASTSANLSGRSPAVRPEDLDPEIQEGVAGVLTIPAGGGVPSTLVDCTQDPPCVLRPGPVGIPALERATGGIVRWCASRRFRVLVVCTGNTCRSPLAHGFLQEAVRRRGLPVDVDSAGTHAWEGAPIAPEVVQVLQEAGIPFSHRSQMLTPERVAWADLILAMTEEHRRFVEAMGGKGKVVRFAAYDMPDPVGHPLSQYRWVAGLIRRELDRWLTYLEARVG